MFFPGGGAQVAHYQAFMDVSPRKSSGRNLCNLLCFSNLTSTRSQSLPAALCPSDRYGPSVLSLPCASASHGFGPLPFTKPRAATPSEGLWPISLRACRVDTQIACGGVFVSTRQLFPGKRPISLPCWHRNRPYTRFSRQHGKGNFVRRTALRHQEVFSGAWKVPARGTQGQSRP